MSSSKRPGIDSELARRMAHEIRSPLGVIVGGLDEVAARPDLPADAAGFLTLARRSAGRLDRMVQRLDWIAALQVGATDEPEQPEPLRDVVERGAREAEGFAGRRAIRVTCEVAPGTAAHVRGSNGTRQIVQELVHNAVRHAKTRVDVRVAVADGVPRVRIEHDGAPLDPERLLADDDSTHASGLGLGLWICRALCQRLGATLHVDTAGITLELTHQ